MSYHIPTAPSPMDSNGSADGASERCPDNLCAHVLPAYLSDNYGKDVNSLLHGFCSKCSFQAEVEPLCGFCKHLRLRHLAICLGDKSYDLRFDLELGCDSSGNGISRIVSNNGCALCCLLASVIHSCVIMFSKLEGDEEVIRKKTRLSLEVESGYGRCHMSLHITMPDTRYTIDIALRAASQDSRPTTHRGQISWPAVQQWIQKCSDEHACARSEHSTMPQGFRLIDVNDRKVKSDFLSSSRLGRDIKFVALSYVWGTTAASREDALLESNKNELEASNGLGKISVPRAIEDAMTVCRQLGQRFLWVDRFCIQQDGMESEKKEQINAMGDIYSAAEFTIIHASGTSMHDPIAGVSTARETFQLKKGVCGLEYMIHYPDLQIALQKSRWVERGWTYQEAVLSRRKLIFTPFELWFECNDTREAYQREHQYSLDRNNITLGTLRQEQYRIGGHAEKRTIFLHFARHLEAYTRRSLTQQSDILDAFQGILATLYNSRLHIYGLPEADFGKALLWYCKGNHITTGGVLGLPSWSWASVIGPITAGEFLGDLYRETLVEWFYKDQNGELIPVRSETFIPSGHQSHANTQALLLVAWWKECIEHEIPEDVRGKLEKGFPACAILNEPRRRLIEKVWEHLEDTTGELCAECKYEIEKRWPCSEDVWTDIRKARDSGHWKTQNLRNGFRGEDRLLIEKLRPGVLLTRAQTAYFRVFMAVELEHAGFLRIQMCLTDSGGRRIGLIRPNCVAMTLQMAMDNTMPRISQGDAIECIGVSLGVSCLFGWLNPTLISWDSRLELRHSLRELASAMSAKPTMTENMKYSSNEGLDSQQPMVNVLIIHRQEGSPFARRIGAGFVFFKDWLKADRTFQTIALE